MREIFEMLSPFRNSTILENTIKWNDLIKIELIKKRFKSVRSSIYAWEMEYYFRFTRKSGLADLLLDTKIFGIHKLEKIEKMVNEVAHLYDIELLREENDENNTEVINH